MVVVLPLILSLLHRKIASNSQDIELQGHRRRLKRHYTHCINFFPHLPGHHTHRFQGRRCSKKIGVPAASSLLHTGTLPQLARRGGGPEG